MSNRHAALGIIALLGVTATATASPTAAEQLSVVSAAVEGCCACAMCDDGDRCIDRASLASCNDVCAAANCQRVSFSLTGTCADGCAPAASQAGDAVDETSRDDGGTR